VAVINEEHQDKAVEVNVIQILLSTTTAYAGGDGILTTASVESGNTMMDRPLSMPPGGPTRRHGGSL
jgi:hypothetical protein